MFSKCVVSFNRCDFVLCVMNSVWIYEMGMCRYLRWTLEAHCVLRDFFSECACDWSSQVS